jgi:FKBP-type peptidyl-prolyl cis-trans isomerase FklB
LSPNLKKSMRIVLCLLCVLLLSGTSIAQKKSSKKKNTTPVQPPAFSLKNSLDSVSYSIGLNIAQSVKTQGIDSINLEAVNKGMQDFLHKGNLLLTTEQGMQLLNSFMKEAYNRKLEANKKAGEAFLSAIKAKPGVSTTASGLQYQVMVKGSGAMPKAEDKVKVHYRGTLIDGTEFDSSYKRGEPATFGVNQVIAGWTEALQLMPVGSKWMLYIPSNLAYGERGAGPQIQPNSTLVFEVELLEIVK